MFTAFKRLIGLAITSFALTCAAAGEAAPAFSLLNTAGETVNLADFRGQPVILEWTNHDCPFVRKHYETGNMQRLQREMTDKGVVWLTIISSAPGKQGYVEPGDADTLTKSRGAYPTHVLLDPEGQVGRLYSARTTPHMYLIAQDGGLLYQGAIDDKPSARHETVDEAKNYVRTAVSEMEAGKPISVASTKPYGCTVKYKG